jgi:hypothetical protein
MLTNIGNGKNVVKQIKISTSQIVQGKVVAHFLHVDLTEKPGRVESAIVSD